VNARHLKESTRWGTPPEWVTMARQALGGRIERDPMSEARFNEIVGAEHFWTEQDDCFAQPDWSCGSMLINPAGGLVVRAWQRLVSEFTKGNVRRAIWIGFSVEQLAILADEPLHPDDFSKLTARQRIPFVHHDRDVTKRQPSHANYVVGLGIAAEDFERAFLGKGRFHHGKLAITRPAHRGQQALFA
jgi:hypothetical protein